MLSEAKYKGKYGMSLKILTSKQMLQRLPISLAQAKAGNTSEILYILCIDQKKLLKNYITIYKCNKVIKQNGHNVYEFW